ncbi:MAG: crotonobetainyl-CoA:carnitine CoA-transferase CaiB-like acyl-CoA transferase [Gammaproteobacteria bacterium]|jgi:crotonobetainyl-CoA:carnitine CoA-transferase CaiB-like acyl-CoA transferase
MTRPLSAIKQLDFTHQGVADREQVRASGMIVDAVHLHAGPVRWIGNPTCLRSTPPQVANEDSLKALGDNAAQIERLTPRGH